MISIYNYAVTCKCSVCDNKTNKLIKFTPDNQSNSTVINLCSKCMVILLACLYDDCETYSLFEDIMEQYDIDSVTDGNFEFLLSDDGDDGLTKYKQMNLFGDGHQTSKTPTLDDHKSEEFNMISETSEIE